MGTPRTGLTTNARKNVKTVTRQACKVGFDDLMREIENVHPFRPKVQWKAHHDKFILFARDNRGLSFPQITIALNASGFKAEKETVRSRYNQLKKGNKV